MAKELTVSETLEREGVDLMEITFCSVVPACCSEDCQVEPDGRCQHGYDSVLIKEGLI